MERDVSGWAVIGPELDGQDEAKFWLAEHASADQAEHWLWKPRRFTDDGSVEAINDVAEVVASRLARRLGVPSARCEFAVRHGQPGVISANVTPVGWELHGAAVYLAEIEGYSRVSPVGGGGSITGRVRADKGYTLSAVAEVLAGVGGPPRFEQLSGLETFAGYLTLDALIANTDRHPRNWAILQSASSPRRRIAPSFDHGSALGSGMSDARRARRDVRAFCRSGRAKPFDPPDLLVDLAGRAAGVVSTTKWARRVAALTPADFEQAISAPPGRLSVVASNFVTDVLTENQRRLRRADDDED